MRPWSQVIIAGSKDFEATLFNDQAANAASPAMEVEGFSVVAFEISGTFVADINFQGSIDGTNWYNLSVSAVGNGLVGHTTSEPGLYRASVSGLSHVRARVTSYSSGAVTVRAKASTMPPMYSPAGSRQVVLPRAVRTSGTFSRNLLVPASARSANAELRIHGITGTFGTGEGVGLIQTGILGPTNFAVLPRITGERYTTTGIIAHHWGVGDLGDADASGGGRLEFKRSSVFTGEWFQVTASISGTFGPGEGVDCELIVHFHG